MGQITPDTAFGAALRALAMDPRHRFWVEAGGSDGQGSTRCIMDGFADRAEDDVPAPELISIEAHPEFHRIATEYWKGSDPSLGLPRNLHFVWGRLAESMMGEQEVRNHPLFEKVRDHFNLHFRSDQEMLRMAPVVRPNYCDVAVLDGGEFCGAADWAAIRVLKPKVVALNDIQSMKNYDVYKKLLWSGWRVLFVTAERNGSAILESPGMDEKYYSDAPIPEPVGYSGWGC